MGNDGARHLTPLLPRRPIRPDRHGGFQLTLSGDDRERLRQLAPEFSALLDEPEHPALRRLFPPAYAQESDSEREEEYRRLMLEDLVARHRDELDLLAVTASKEHLTEEEVLAWTRALNSIRLVLGTVLDVSEGDEGRAPETYEEALYHWLTYLLGEAIEALGGD